MSTSTSTSTPAEVRVFLLPDLGEGLTEVEVVEWKVAVGDTVVIDQVVVEVETAKATVEVPSPYAGVVEVLHGTPGTTIIVGTPLVTIGAPAGPRLSGNVLIGYGTSEIASRRRRRPPSPSRLVSPAVEQTAGVPVLSPIIRKLAKDNGIDTSTLAGSGEGGVVTRRDVEAAIHQRAVPAALGDQPDARIDSSAMEERIPLTGLRRAVADKVSTSRREIPDATTWVDVDATELVNARRMINASADEPISLLALLARLCIAALTRFPELNSSVDIHRREIVRYRHINLGIAAQTPLGLMVPVIYRADALTTDELSRALRETTTQAKNGALPPGRLSGGTFTLNNYGVFGVDGSTPIINHPEAAILGVGRIVDKPWVVDGQLAVRKVTQLSLTFDHRVCDGGVAGGFLRLLSDYVENPVIALGRA
jgi:2-oxoisovalerate dehydrogenase E2 component (dihydrolipoyl transacylase)